MSFPAPDVVLQALSRGAVPASMKRLTRAIARFLRIGDSFDIRQFVEADEIKHCLSKVFVLFHMGILFGFTMIYYNGLKY